MKAVCESSTIAMKFGYADASGWRIGNGRSYVEKKGRKGKLDESKTNEWYEGGIWG